MNFDPGNRLILALDLPDKASAMSLAAKTKQHVGFVKVGLELYCAEGAALVREITESGQRVMLDLKLHDIPATVGRATRRVADLGCELLTIHSCGGPAMMEAALEASEEVSKGSMKILAVTVLTSLDQGDLDAVGVRGTPSEVALRRAQLAKKAGCHGIVASPAEASLIRGALGKDLLIVTPGIRLEAGNYGDQKRVTTPTEARRLGADLVVVGRPIRDAADPSAAARTIAQQLGG